jgi:hypothetical protein
MMGRPTATTVRGRAKRTWRRMVEEEIGEEGKVWKEVAAIRWRFFVEAVCS